MPTDPTPRAREVVQSIWPDGTLPSADVKVKLALALDAATGEARDRLEIAEDRLTSEGYRRSCDIPACNCGDRWGHGGHAYRRLHEITEALGERCQGRTPLKAVVTLIEDLATERATTAAAVREVDEHRKHCIILTQQRLAAERATAAVRGELEDERKGRLLHEALEEQWRDKCLKARADLTTACAAARREEREAIAQMVEQLSGAWFKKEFAAAIRNRTRGTEGKRDG